MTQTGEMLAKIWQALGGQAAHLAHLRETGQGSLTSAFALSDFAAASTGAAGLALAELVAAQGGPFPEVSIDRRLASMWFAKSIRPLGWALPPQWDAIAGNYEARDGWIRLHTNAPHHRAAALRVLGVENDRALVSQAVARWDCAGLEEAVVAAGGCAARMMGLAEWRAHEQGASVGAEALVARRASGTHTGTAFGRAGRPLEGLRVLDLTRVLAGPVATRFLAGFGANVLRIDPPYWNEPAVLPEVTIGKRRARLDLHASADRAIFEGLLGQADVLVHGYRADALAHRGYDEATRLRLAPGLIDVALDAYGWTGPWQARRGFDTIVQMSTGLAAREMDVSRSRKPVALAVQALDYGTGYLIAAAVLRGLTERLATGQTRQARLSLARTAAFVAEHPMLEASEPLASETAEDLASDTEVTHWGPARRLKAPVAIVGCEMKWDLPAGELGDSAASFD